MIPWTTCGGAEREHASRNDGPAARARVSRREILGVASGAAAAWLARADTALAQSVFAPPSGPRSGRALVVVFLRGGADGLNMIVPHGDDAYHALRPTLRLAAPGDRGAAAADRALDLDSFFGLHPALAPLRPLYAQGQMAAVHACGSGDQSRSHFEAMRTMERGLAADPAGAASGWMARYLAASPPAHPSPLRAVALTNVMPDSLRGAPQATALSSIADYRLEHPAGGSAALVRSTLSSLYGTGSDAVREAGRETLAVLDTVGRAAAAAGPETGAYPDSDLGRALRQVAALRRAEVGLETAFIDRGGWDTHVAQGSAGGWMAAALADLAGSLAAFTRDIGSLLERTTIIVMTEFGRRAAENSALGTDHGRASAMLVIGGGVRGGRVLARWPGLAEDALEPPGDLRVTTDYRSVLAAALAELAPGAEIAPVFPGLVAPRPDLWRAA